MMIFEPNENLKKVVEKISVPSLKGKSIQCNFPNRIHITPIDCNRFNYGKPGGGGIGFALKANNYLKIQLASETEFAGDEKVKPVALRALYAMSHNLGFADEFKITVNQSQEVKAHIGLGSNACLLTAICSSINELYDSPLSKRELMQIIGANFVEEYNGKCVLGLDTGVAPATSLYGGCCLVSEESVVVWQNDFDFIPKALLVFPNTARASFEGAEDDVMLKRSFYEDLKSRGNISYEILMDLIPAIVNKDLHKIGDVIWNIQFSGTHLSMIQGYEDYGAKIYGLFGKIKSLGAEIVGLSSVGPCIFVISKNMQSILEYLQSENIENMLCDIQTKPIEFIFD